MTRLFRRRGTALAVLTTAALLGAACATPNPHGTMADAHEGDPLPSRVRVLIPYAEGGGTDVWGRFIGNHLGGHIETGTRFVPENVPGGESIIGSNRYARSAGNDGSEVLVSSGTTYFQYLLGRPEVEFDFGEMRPLVINGSGGVIYGSVEGGVTSVDDLFSPSTPLQYGGISITGLDLSAVLAFEVLGLDVTSTFGFEGRGPARLAIERGELNVDYQTTSGFLTQVQPLIDEGRAVPLMSLGQLDDAGEVIRDPNVPDLPTVPEVYEEHYGEPPSGPGWDAYKTFLAAGFSYQKGLWVREDTPDSVVQPVFDAVRELQRDEAFLEQGREVLGGYPLYAGDEVEESVRAALRLDDSVREYVLDLLAENYGTVIAGS
ncbi:Bug family tripartite tricarboxylate transporter substrate binding protein [Actinoalloteichus caeruleus]|uniref:Bug family tripartite tricarboxylate transporter substrate binding protein n=1 Tax=Actinoalloteichus cyanogriseus TaxID=2893586 RepID=UPI0004AABF46|nr:hypothetical protein [Actinoalloteichus caeruleus]